MMIHTYMIYMINLSIILEENSLSVNTFTLSVEIESHTYSYIRRCFRIVIPDVFL